MSIRATLIISFIICHKKGLITTCISIDPCPPYCHVNPSLAAIQLFSSQATLETKNQYIHTNLSGSIINIYLSKKKRPRINTFTPIFLGVGSAHRPTLIDLLAKLQRKQSLTFPKKPSCSEVKMEKQTFQIQRKNRHCTTVRDSEGKKSLNHPKKN